MKQYGIENNEDRKTYITELFADVADDAVDMAREGLESIVGDLVKIVGIRLGEIGEDWFDTDYLYSVHGGLLVLVTIRTYDGNEKSEIVDMRSVTEEELDTM